jgi:class 3 adenylate cyclase
MFTDICGSTPLVEVLGDEAWSDLVSWHDATLRRLFADSGGEELDHAGDGFFVAFSDAHSAVSCAVAIQRQLKQHRREHGFAPDVRIGIHEAEAARAGRQIRGKGVHTAARIGATALAGEILVSTQTLDGVTGPVSVDRRQTVNLKGLTHPVEVASIAWQAPLDSH